ncbi:MAG: hypothetical protein BroJett030_09810 [Alphaproteobacteria bacterium]|nr:MAG: hypothetical protein BroJett030_09810 [Alphaproteobacteria bacterium]
MPTRLAAAAAAIASWLVAAVPAAAHEAIPGVTGFAALMLHPLVIAEQLLLVLAAALVAGRMPAAAFASAAFAFIAGLMAGKGAHLAVAWLSAYWYAPLVAALIAGLAVAGLRAIAPLFGVAMVFALAFVLSVGIVPDEPTGAGLVKAVAAAGLTGLAILLVVGLPLTRVRGFRGSVAVRVAGAWIGAIALINLALAYAAIGRLG